MRSIALEFIAKLVEHKIAFMIVETWRTQKRHKELLASGHSWTKNSKHLRGDIMIGAGLRHDEALIVPASHAIDLVPWKIYDVTGPDKLLWDSDDPIWDAVGKIGKVVGLEWGGDWKVRDMAHWELTGDWKVQDMAHWELTSG